MTSSITGRCSGRRGLRSLGFADEGFDGPRRFSLQQPPGRILFPGGSRSFRFLQKQQELVLVQFSLFAKEPPRQRVELLPQQLVFLLQAP